MAAGFSEVVDAYARLEADVQRKISALFGGVCALCTSTCCTPDICEESVDSAFLRELRLMHQKDVFFCDRFGWLTESGCALEYGRPPVCYGFFCNDIVDSMNNTERDYVRVLGRIVSWVGERAMGNRHLVEIMDVDMLRRINCERINSRIAVARLALAGVTACAERRDCSEEQAAAMHKVAVGGGSRSAE